MLDVRICETLFKYSDEFFLSQFDVVELLINIALICTENKENIVFLYGIRLLLVITRPFVLVPSMKGPVSVAGACVAPKLSNNINFGPSLIKY